MSDRFSEKGTFLLLGPELLEQDESGTQKNVQKFVIERIIRINPCSRDIVEATQHSDTDEDKEEEEEFGPRNTTTILEAFIGSKPAISGTSTCPTGYAPSAGSRAVSDLFRDTFMRFCGTEEDGRSEDNLLFHTFPNFDDPSDQPRDIFDDATAGDGHQSSDEKTRKYELMEEFLRDSMLRSLYSNLQGEAANPWGSARDGYQNKAKTMVFHQDTKCTSLAPTKQVQTTSTEDNRQYTHCLPSDPPMNVIKDPYDAFKELIWNSQFTSSDTHKSDSPVQAPRADSQVTIAPHVNDETRKDQNDVHQKSSAGLQKYSEIMDLLEIFPGQHRREDPQEEKTRKWIEKINKNLEDEKEQGRRAKSNRPKGERSKKKYYHNHNKISRARLSRKGNITSRVNLYTNKKYIPFQSEQSSSNVSICDSNNESAIRDTEGQRFLVYMHEGSHLFKEKCKHGISNHLPKSPYWIRGNNNYNRVLTAENEPSNDMTIRKPAKDHKHSHHGSHRHRHRHKRRGSSDDSLSDKTKVTRKKGMIVRKPKSRGSSDESLHSRTKDRRKKEMIVRKPKTLDISERLHRDVRVPSRSLSESSNSDSFAYDRRVAPKERRHSNERNRKHTHRENFRYSHRHSLDGVDPKKYEEHRSSKNNRINVDSVKPKNDPPKSVLKKSNLRRASSTSINESDTSSTDSSSYLSISSRKSKDHVLRGRLVKHPNTQTARHVKLTHSQTPIKRVRVKRKNPNVLHNYRHRLITADSKSSASYERVNVKDFIDFLATLSRNTISTLTNKKKALRLYRNYLSYPRHR